MSRSPARSAPKRRTYHHGDLASALVKEATRVVEQHGHDAVKMREVARAVGVSAAAPFRHFEDRADLLRAVSLRAAERFDEQAARAMAEAGDDPLLQFRALGLAHVRFSLQHPNLVRLLQLPDMREAPSGATEAERAFLATFHARTRALVEAAQRRGTIRVGDPAVFELAGIALAYGLSQLFLEGQLPRKGAEPLVEAVLDVLGAGLQPSRPS